MNVVYLALGAVLLAGTVVDLLWTTLWVEGGAGPLTSRVMAWTWRTLRRLGSENPWLRSLSGVVIFVLSLAMWILLLWSGWTLLFASAERALVDTLHRGPVSWADRFYFTGYTIFTLGIGDFVPRTGRWQFVTTLATASGLLFITLSVTYTLSVLDAVTQKRAFANNVNGLGTRSEAIVRRSWNGETFRALDHPLDTIATQLNTLTANHKAYPILHYFHSTQAARAPVVEIAILDEALTLYRFGIPSEDRPNEIVLRTARASVQRYLETLHEAFIDPADRTPPAPALTPLREAGIPTVSDDEFAESLRDVRDRRRTLLGLVESDARRWPSEAAESE
ncbi:potassium channel family protein [Natrinema salifodinae]|uniref:Ion channel n=1 Tax=Natrinema salifodinae TaxID=1202768 RepID=A0A1I0QUU3_9EURY|nr:potassium channel family protein [Natrinema salifodinae]SEW31396.1 Ion channel [Natrinema salifodinae]